MPLKGETIRDIGYLAWKDDSASLERMSGTAWNSAVAAENAVWHRAARGAGTSVKEFERELRVAATDLSRIQFRPGWNPLTMTAAAPYGHFRTFTFSDDKAWWWVVKDAHNGAERYDLTAYHRGEPVWTIRDVGPSLSILDGRCYYLKSERIHWHREMRSCDAESGRDDRSEFVVSSDQENLEIISTRSGAVYLRVENAGASALMRVDQRGQGQGLRQSPSGWQVPIGDVYYIRKEGDDYYRPHGGSGSGSGSGSGRGHALQLAAHERPLWGCSEYKILIVRWNNCGGLRIYVRGRIIAEYDIATFTVGIAIKGEPQEILIQTPTGCAYLYEVDGNGRVNHRLIAGEAEFEYKIHGAASQDGAAVSYVIVQGRTQGRTPRGLIVYGYGAYGVPTFNGRISSLWGPLIKRGWAIAYAMIRGGGDSTDAWAQAGRLTGRPRAIEDFEAVIAAARATLNVPAEHTVIAGRSAGGLLVGAAITRNLSGRLFKGVYSEVPYVDLLRTTTNPELPLTTVEYNEFGWPEKRVEDFATLLRLSPIDALPAEGAPRIFVLCRSGINDTQVLAYEPMKWIRRLRGVRPAAGEAKLLALKAGQGHFYSTGGAAEAARAMDLCILNGWVARKKNRLDKYKKMAEMMRKSRKERKERKSRKNMAGGKKTMKRKASRKATRKGRKATRKGRKATRKH